MRTFRMTTRRWMIVILLFATFAWVGALARRRQQFLELADWHRRSVSEIEGLEALSRGHLNSLILEYSEMGGPVDFREGGDFMAKPPASAPQDEPPGTVVPDGRRDREPFGSGGGAFRRVESEIEDVKAEGSRAARELEQLFLMKAEHNARFHAYQDAADRPWKSL